MNPSAYHYNPDSLSQASFHRAIRYASLQQQYPNLIANIETAIQFKSGNDAHLYRLRAKNHRALG